MKWPQAVRRIDHFPIQILVFLFLLSNGFFNILFTAQLRNVVLDENLPLSEQWENSVRLF